VTLAFKLNMYYILCLSLAYFVYSFSEAVQEQNLANKVESQQLGKLWDWASTI